MKYTDMLFKVIKDHPDWSPKVHVLAARYYLGDESDEDMEAHTQPRPIFRGHVQKPLLTIKEARDIIEARP